jgi:hypothetical protein
MPINITENLHNITNYLEKSNFADYISNPFYMSMLNSVLLFIFIVILGQEISLSLIFFIILYSCAMFFTFSYAYKKTIKPKEQPLLYPGMASTMGISDGLVPRNFNNNNNGNNSFQPQSSPQPSNNNPPPQAQASTIENM